MFSITIIVNGLKSPLVRTLAIAKVMRVARHKITFLGPHSTEQLIRENGFAFQEIATPNTNMFAPVLPKLSAIKRRSHNLRKERLQETINQFQIGGLAETLKVLQPDLVLIDSEMHAHILVAKTEGYKVAQLACMYQTPPGLRAPPLHHYTIPGVGFLGSKPMVAASWAAYFGRKWATLQRNAWRDWGGDQPSAIMSLARSLGIDMAKLRRYWSWQMPWTYHLPLIVLAPRALNLPIPRDPLLYYSGSHRLDAAPKGRPVDAAVSMFCDPQAMTGKKRILAVFGTVRRPSAAYLNSLFQILTRHPDWHLLCAVSNYHEIKTDDCPANVDLVDWVPQLDALETADLLISHGGLASVQESIEAKVPLLIHPQTIDQGGNGARVAYYGLGRLGHSIDGADKIEQDIEAIFSDPQVPTGLNRMREAFHAEKETYGVNRIVQELVDADRRAS